MIKILFCIRQASGGGGETHLISLLKTIDKNVFSPHVLSFQPGKMIEDAQLLGVKTTVIEKKTLFDHKAANSIRSLLNQERFDLIHAHGTKACFNIVSHANKLNIPIIYTIHGWSFHPDQSILSQFLRRKLEYYLIKKSAKCITVSNSNFVTGRKYFPNFSAAIVPNGVDTRDFDPELTFPNLKEVWGFRSESPVVTFISRFTKQKQPLTLIESFHEAFKKNNDLRLVLTGGGELDNEIKAKVENLNLSGVVRILNFSNNVASILANSDVYVLPSLWEGLPIGLLEAMAMKKASIATSVDGTDELIQNGYNGIKIPLASIKSQLANEILNLTSNKQLRNTLGENARNTIIEKYSIHAMKTGVEKIYREIYYSRNLM